MYVDNMVFTSETIIDGIQYMLNYLVNYTKTWNLEINIMKTKIVILRNGGIIRDNYCQLYNGKKKLKVSNESCYL